MSSIEFVTSKSYILKILFSKVGKKLHSGLPVRPLGKMVFPVTGLLVMLATGMPLRMLFQKWISS